MTTILPFVDVPFENKEAFKEFLLVHKLAHVQIETYFQDHNQAISSLPEDVGLEHDPNAWLQVHDDIHHQIGQFLNQQGIPDLESVDLNDREQFADWMEVHGSIHDQINQLTGLM